VPIPRTTPPARTAKDHISTFKRHATELARRRASAEARSLNEANGVPAKSAELAEPISEVGSTGLERGARTSEPETWKTPGYFHIGAYDTRRGSSGLRRHPGAR